jgi:hypothetical protein
LPADDTDTFYVSIGLVGLQRPQGKSAENAEKDQLVDDASKRITDYIENLDHTGGVATLENTITSNQEDVKLALDHLKSVGISFDSDLKKIEDAYKIIKDPQNSSTELNVISAQQEVTEAKIRLLTAVRKVYQDSLRAEEEPQSAGGTASITPGKPNTNSLIND